MHHNAFVTTLQKIEQMEKQEFERSIEVNLHNYVMQVDSPNEFLVQLIDRAGGYLNLQTIADYAKEHKMSYNGVKKCRKIITLFNTKFVVDNDWATNTISMCEMAMEHVPWNQGAIFCREQ